MWTSLEDNPLNVIHVDNPLQATSIVKVLPFEPGSSL